MRSGWILVSLLLATTPALAQEPAAVPAPPDSSALRMGLKLLPAPFAIEFPLSPGSSSLWLRPRYTDWVEEWSRATSSGLAAQRAAMLGPAASAVLVLATLPDTSRYLTGALRDTTPFNPLPDAIAQYADIGMMVTGRGELGGAWQRYQPCDPGIQFTCNPSLFPQLKPDVQFGIQVGGTISDRIHVNVDYDQRREFDAANNIQVYYEGKEDEILRRVEVGDVSIRLPASRYVTNGIPSGNFGFKAEGQLGPIDFQTIFAQQKGDVTTREFRLGGTGNTTGLVQEDTAQLDDEKYARGQFFFVVSPDSITGAPHIDVLELQSGDAPSSLRPALGDIQLYRDERPSIANQQQQAQLGYFLADAVAPDPVLRHGGLFRRLVPGDDYLVHSSGLWLMLRAPLRPDEALAIAYVTQSGDTIGKLNAERATGQTPVLRLVRGPGSSHQPGTSTWDYEMHQVYRVDTSNAVEAGSVDLRISIGELASGRTSVDAGTRRLALLKLFGMDEDAPFEQIDPAQIFQPARLFGGEPQQNAKIGGTYVIFPTLRPFAEPPPLPSIALSAAETRAALGSDANAAIYDNPDPVVRESSTRFRLTFAYRVNVEGLVSSFNLGAMGIREGSDKLHIGGLELQRGTDYDIDYDLGVVTLKSAENLFGTNPDAEIRATWEQKAIFQIAPTSVFGVNARYLLGGRGELNFMGLYQAEKSLMSRPSLGLEPAAIFLGGASGRVALGGRLIDRALSFLPGLRLGGLSALNVNGEMALSLPNPNTHGETFLEDFEATDDLPLSLRREAWRLGSRPNDTFGAGDAFPVSLDISNAMRLVWQHEFTLGGQTAGPLFAEDIDRQINVAGRPLPETVLYLSPGDPAAPAEGKEWRAITTVLSSTGRDMSRTEFLEFYVSGNMPEGSLVFDLGTVGEDAFYFDANGRTNGRYPDGKEWGLGVLDEEASLVRREIWSVARDTLGLWNEDCRADRGARYPLGDPTADCTRNNGLVDTEDLSGSSIPSLQDGQYFRYVVRLDRASPFLVRDNTGANQTFRLYRIPLRRANSFSAVGGATAGTWREIKHMRMTVVGAPAGIDTLVVARMRLIGSRWTKRDSVGVFSGLIGDRPSPTGQAANFEPGPVSRLTVGNAYTPPPGVGDQLQDLTAQFGNAGVEFNEKSLRLSFDRLEAGDRAEVYFRYAQQPRNLLSYRSLRVWAVPRRGSWGPSGDERLIIKLGSDARNYYMYRTPLRPAVTGTVAASDWLPEILIDFDRWFELKARAEQELIVNGPRVGEPLVVWSADSTYGIVLEDRARAPNLAAVRELAFAVHNSGGFVQPGEVWIDDMRLSSAMTNPGFAGNVNVDFRGGDFLFANVAYANQGALFHQLNQDASYLRTGDLALTATANLGQLAPSAWGIEMPLTISHGRNAQDPTFLDRSDVLASRLDGLRDAGGRRTRVGLGLRKRTPTANPFLGLLLDGLALRFGYNDAQTGTVISRDEAGGFDGGIAYNRRIGVRDFDIIPAVIERALRGLFPAKIENSDFFRRLSGARLRWTPEAISFNTGYYQQESRSYRFDRILRTENDDAVRPIEAPRAGLDGDARVSIRPFESLNADFSLNSSRDLLDSERATEQLLQQRAIDAARARFGGVDVGWETNRTLGTLLNWRPLLSTWLRPSVTYTARFRTNRNPSYLQVIPEGADSSALLQRQFQGDRQLTRGVQLDPGAFITSAFGAPDSSAGFARRALRAAVTAFRPVEVTWNTGLNSQYERADFDPDVRYQFGLGGLGKYRLMSGDTAVNAGARDAFRARTGLTLPFGTGIELAYDRNDGDIFDLRGGRREQIQRTWPDIRVAWTSVPVPVFMRGIIPRASLSVGLQEADRTDVFGAFTGTGQTRGSHERNIPVQLTFGLGGTANASYTGSVTRGTSTDPTGDARNDALTHTVSVTGAFRAPKLFSEKLRNPLTATLSLNQQAQQQCRELVFGSDIAEPSCVPYVDFLNRGANFTLDTLLDQLRVGLQMSYTSRRNLIGTLTGSSQFQLGFFGEFNFSAGRIPGAPR